MPKGDRVSPYRRNSGVFAEAAVEVTDLIGREHVLDRRQSVMTAGQPRLRTWRTAQYAL
jgi:hypothetical protein